MKKSVFIQRQEIEMSTYLEYAVVRTSTSSGGQFLLYNNNKLNDKLKL